MHWRRPGSCSATFSSHTRHRRGGQNGHWLGSIFEGFGLICATTPSVQSPSFPIDSRHIKTTCSSQTSGNSVNIAAVERAVERTALFSPLGSPSICCYPLQAPTSNARALQVPAFSRSSPARSPPSWDRRPWVCFTHAPKHGSMQAGHRGREVGLNSSVGTPDSWAADVNGKPRAFLRRPEFRLPDSL